MSGPNGAVDQLTPDERRRLEALAQAIVSLGAPMGRPVAGAEVITRAVAFDEFIREGRE